MSEYHTINSLEHEYILTVNAFPAMNSPEGPRTTNTTASARVTNKRIPSRIIWFLCVAFASTGVVGTGLLAATTPELGLVASGCGSLELMPGKKSERLFLSGLLEATDGVGSILYQSSYAQREWIEGIKRACHRLGVNYEQYSGTHFNRSEHILRLQASLW